jgi:type III secretory pathway component EscT
MDFFTPFLGETLCYAIVRVAIVTKWNFTNYSENIQHSITTLYKQVYIKVLYNLI